VLFEVPEAALATMDKVEGARLNGTGNYERATIEVMTIPDGDRVEALTYIGTPAGRDRFKQRAECPAVKSEYFGHLLVGAQFFNFGSDYVRYLHRQAGVPE
jgi:AIG2-like family